MRHEVLSPMHHLRRHIDTVLSTLFPSRAKAALSLTEAFPTRRLRGWTSLYEMVTFRPDVGYSEALRREKWQKEVVGIAGWVIGSGLTVGLGVIGWWTGRGVWRGVVSRS